MRRGIVVLFLVLSTPVLAHGHHSTRHHSHRSYSHNGRPSAWCGWYMRGLLGVRDASFNLARNWSRYGTAASGPGIGVIVVWPHHVGLITGRHGNEWIVKSGNDGHAVRERPRSLAGAIAFRRI